MDWSRISAVADVVVVLKFNLEASKAPPLGLLFGINPENGEKSIFLLAVAVENLHFIAFS